MARKTELTVPEKLLLAALELEKEGQSPFSAEALVVQAWRRFPDTFGLAGYTDNEGNLLHPDSNRVFAEIMGSKPIRKQGYLVKTGRKMYQLTESGRERGRSLGSKDTQADSGKGSIARDIQYEVRRLVKSKAFKKFTDETPEKITFFDACSFWGISPSSSAIEFKGRVENLKSVVDTARRALSSDSNRFKYANWDLTLEDLQKLREVHSFLMEKFKEDVSIIVRRTDERK